MSCNDDIWTIFTNFTIIKSVQIAITKSREAADHGPTLPYAQGAATPRVEQRKGHLGMGISNNNRTATIWLFNIAMV